MQQIVNVFGLKTAFDILNQRILLLELELYHVRRVVLSWLKFHLRNRPQCVNFGGTRPILRDIICSFPKDSTLASLLLFIHNLGLSTSCRIFEPFLFGGDRDIVLQKSRDMGFGFANLELKRLPS